MKNSDYSGWLAIGSKGRVHFFNQIDEMSPMKRIAACGRKFHVFSLIEPTEQSRCVICVKCLGDAGIEVASTEV